MKAAVLLLLGAFPLGTGCSSPPEPPGNDPALEALVSHVESQSFDLSFWRSQAHRESQLWQIAVAFCDKHQRLPLPNCDLVWIARSAEAGAFFPRSQDLHGTAEPLVPDLLFRQPSYGEVALEETPP